jgi:hypothetical protein
VNGHGHVLVIWTDKKTKQVDFLRVTLTPSFSRIVEIDFVNSRSDILCKSENGFQKINIERLLVPDFPDLVELKRITNLFMVMA